MNVDPSAKSLSRFSWTLPLILAMAIGETTIADEVPGAIALSKCGSLTPNPGVAGDERLTSRLDVVIEDFATAAALVPGLVVGVVRGDQLVYARGFGFRDLSECLPAGPTTGFYLKSTTKSFLGLAIAQMHEEGLIDLDSPITDYLPELVFPKGINGDQISLRSHFTHTQPYFDSGLNYRTAYPGNLPESEWVGHINEWSVAKDIGFRYSNFGPIVGAHAVTVKTGEPWRDMIEKRVFKTIGMKASTTSIAGAIAGDYGVSYLRASPGKFKATQTKSQSQMHAAGGAVSTVNDIARFIIANLNNGQIDEKQVVSHRAIEHAHSRQVYLDWDFLEFHRFAHGLGLYSADYEGELLIHHFGGETHMSFMPEQNYGVMILTNAIIGGVVLTHYLATTIYDLLLDKSDLDARVQRRLDDIENYKSRRAERLKQHLQELADEAPSVESTFTAAQLHGSYVSPRMGEIVIHGAGPNLMVTYGSIGGSLIHLGGDRYSASLGIWGEPPELFVFKRNEFGALILDWGGRLFARSK